MKLCSWLGALLVVAAATFVGADEPAVKLEVQEVLKALNNPTGVAVSTDDTPLVYVAESGAGKVIRVNPASAGKSEDVITGFKLDIYGKGPMYNVGPLGLAFFDTETLVVGDGSLPDGQELLRFYTVPEAGKSLTVDETTYSLGPIAPGEESKLGEGNFYGVAVSDTAIYVTCNGDDTKGWVARVEIDEDGEPESLEPFIATKELTEVDAPVGIAINRRGHIVIGQMGEINKPKDSLLTFYSPKTGKVLMNLETGLYDIVALAYNPRSGRLYALDFAWMDEKQGGLYRLDATQVDGKHGVKAVKLLSLDKPTAMAFEVGEDSSTLYVTEFGTAKEGSDAKAGRLLKITGDL